MILDCLGIIATLFVRAVFKDEKEKQLLDKISSLFVFTDGTQKKSTSCGMSVLRDAEVVAKVVSAASKTPSTIAK